MNGVRQSLLDLSSVPCVRRLAITLCSHFDLSEVYLHCFADTDLFNRFALELRDASRQRPLTLHQLGCGYQGRSAPLHAPAANTTGDKRPWPTCIAARLPGRLSTHCFPSMPTCPRCHELMSQKVSWQVPKATTFRHLVFARLLFLSTDVIYIFADDITRFADVHELLVKLFKWFSMVVLLYSQQMSSYASSSTVVVKIATSSSCSVRPHWSSPGCQSFARRSSPSATWRATYYACTLSCSGRISYFLPSQDVGRLGPLSKTPGIDSQAHIEALLRHS